MSGGNLNYAYHKINDIIYEIKNQSKKPLYLAFAKHLELIEVALKDLELMLSGDTSDGDEEAAIRKVVSPIAELASVKEEAEKIMLELKKTLKRTK